MTKKTDGFPKDVRELEEKIGYKFIDRKVLVKALCHSSYANEKRTESNERLEFLGDAVLSKIVSEYLYCHYPNYDEGKLSNTRRQIVEGRSLSEFARMISLGDYLYLGNGEENGGGRDHDKNLENAFEALIAAIYIDGGDEEAENFVLPFAVEKANQISPLSDPKSLLQEVVQKQLGELKYVHTGSEGPDHKKTFFCEVCIDGNVFGKGSGATKKEAEEAAAVKALEYLGINGRE